MASMEWINDRNNWYKDCSRCGKEFSVIIKDSDQITAYNAMLKFFGPASRELDGLDHGCRSCMIRQRHKRTGTIHRDDMLESQDYKCAICSQSLEVTGRSGGYVDHDYMTKKERGILCNKCNVRMSGVDDDRWLTKAIAYRDFHRKKDK